MKTKEQLKDIKLFADFIGKGLKELKYIDKDTKQEVICEYFDGFNNFFNPQDDWNLLHKAYNKVRITTIDNKQDDSVFKYSLKTMEVCLLLNDTIGIYDSILIFIKYYNKINSNTNNN